MFFEQSNLPVGRIIAGITTPTNGKVDITGKVGSILDIGAGFMGELTGHENILLKCSLIGLNSYETKKVYPEIVDFAGLGNYLHHQVKTYSTGMSMRLGFSVAVSIDPDILLIDEIIMVGDEYFQDKCLKKIGWFKQKQKSNSEMA